MPIYATAGTNGQTFTPAPAGVHQAVCVDVIDLGLLEVTYAGKTKKQHKITLAWQIDERRDDGKRYLVFKRYTCSINEKAALRKDLESWRGKPFTTDEEHQFDVETVIGVNCLINVQHKTVADKTYANVMAVMPLHKGMTKLKAEDYVRQQDRKDTPTDEASTGESLAQSFAHAGVLANELTDDDIPF